MTRKQLRKYLSGNSSHLMWMALRTDPATFFAALKLRREKRLNQYSLADWLDDQEFEGHYGNSKSWFLFLFLGIIVVIALYNIVLLFV